MLFYQIATRRSVPALFPSITALGSTRLKHPDRGYQDPPDDNNTHFPYYLITPATAARSR